MLINRITLMTSKKANKKHMLALSPDNNRYYRVAPQNEAADAADAAAYIGASGSSLERRRAVAYRHRRECEEQYIDDHQQQSVSRNPLPCNDFQL